MPSYILIFVYSIQFTQETVILQLVKLKKMVCTLIFNYIDLFTNIVYLLYMILVIASLKTENNLDILKLTNGYTQRKINIILIY